MIRVFQNLYDLAIQRSHWTLVLWSAVLLPLVFLMSHLQIDLDLYGREQKQFPTTVEFQDFKYRFQDAFSTFVIFVPSDQRRFTAQEICQIRNWLAIEVRHDEAVASVASPFDLRTAKREGDRVWYRPLLDLDCNSQSNVDLSLWQNTPWGTTITDHKARDIGAEVVFSEAAARSRFGTFDPRMVSNLIRKTEANFKDKIPGMQIHFVGSPAFQAHLQNALVYDLMLQSLVFVILILTFRYFFGTWRSGIVFLVTLIITLIAVYGMMALTGQPLDLLTNNLLLMTTIAGLEDFLFVAMLMKNSRRSFLDSAREMAAPCFFTTLTTVVGFWSLETAGIDMIGSFGLWAGAATIAEWAVLFLFMPALCKHLPAIGAWIDEMRMSSPRWSKKMAQLKGSRILLWVGAALFVLGIAGFNHININEHPARNFSASHPLTKAYQYISDSRGWQNTISVVFKRDNIDEHRQEIESRLKQIAEHEIVSTTESPFALADFLGRDLADRDKSIPKFEASLLPSYQRLFSGRDQTRAQVYLKTTDLMALDSVVKHIKKVCADGFCAPAGQSVVYLEIAEQVIPALLSSFIGSAVTVSLILWALATVLGLRRKWAIVYSAIWGPFTMVAVIAVLQIPVSLITSVFAAVIVGLTGDNAIQYMFAGQNKTLREGIGARAETSVILAVLLAACSLVFLLESIRPMVILGLLFFTGFFVNLAGDLWLLRGLLEDEES